MPIGRPPIPVRLGEEEELESMTRSLKLAHGLVGSAQIILACAKGEPQVEIGKGLGLSKMTFSKWRHRFHHQGMAGLREEQRPVRARSHDEQRVAEVLNRALQSPPAHGPHWSVRSLSRPSGISKSTVHRWFQLFKLRPHGQGHFKILNDPFFVEKLNDIVGLYLRALDHVVVLCVDEKTQIQAL